MIDTGHPAPDFTLLRNGGGDVKLSSLRPKKVVLYFYPKDDTTGCTREAQDFTERLAAFKAADATVLGVSKDSVAKHDKFRDKYELGVTLLSDESGEVCDTYGTWVEKKMYGKSYMGIERSTFLIDGDGKIAQIWRRVKVPGHADEVLEAAEAL